MDFHDGRVVLHIGDCFDVLDTLPENSIDAVVTDPPYALVSIQKRFGNATEDDVYKNAELRKTFNQGCSPYARAAKGFMGATWDNGQVAFNPELWVKVYRVLKPGGHMVAFGGTRTFHRLVCAIEDAGFEIRDSLAWITGQGFPKSHDISKKIDEMKDKKRNKIKFQARPKTCGTFSGSCDSRPWIEESRKVGYHEVDDNNPISEEAKKWSGFGSALKPSMELITLCRKPLSEPTIAANVLKWGTGALNIDGCRIDLDGDYKCRANGRPSQTGLGDNYEPEKANKADTVGRWPANFCHSGEDEVLALFPDIHGAGHARNGKFGSKEYDASSYKLNFEREMGRFGDEGSVARFFYTAKASELDRIGSHHPTVKPVSLMRWLVRLVTPPNGTVLDMFAGTGTTGQAAILEGFKSVLIEREVEYVKDIERRMKLVFEKTPLKREKGSADGATLF